MKVLIVDDQEAVRLALQVLFDVHGLPTLVAQHPDEVLHFVRTEDVGVVVQDMNFSQQETSGQEGIALFRAIKQLDPALPVLLMTAWTSLETAVALVKEGAADYVAKPWDDDKLVRSVENLLRLRAAEQENLRLRAQHARARQSLSAAYDLCGLIYASPAMHQVVSLAVHVAASDAPVLITGPNGVGKEKLAEIIQANSRRKDKPFVKVNAGGLPDELLQAELFGAEVGAFTGATRMRIGRFEAADGGTLFLDEIGNLTLPGQAKLLRVLQTGEYERLGSSVARRANVRIVSATNTDLRSAIAAGQFREDLYFRLNVIELKAPPLADRQDDILPLAQRFLEEFATDAGPCTLTEEARSCLLQHDWSGNVRELRNRIQRASLVCAGGRITPADLDLLGKAEREAVSMDGDGNGAGKTTELPGKADPERIAIEEALLAAGGVVSKAAAELGLSRQALYRRMERLAIVLERRPKA